MDVAPRRAHYSVEVDSLYELNRMICEGERSKNKTKTKLDSIAPELKN